MSAAPAGRLGVWLAPLKRRFALWNRRRIQRRRLARLPAYADWCLRHDRPDPVALAQRLASLPETPSIALLLPPDAGPPAACVAMLASLQAQIYPHWVLLVGLAPAPDPDAESESPVWWQRQAASDSRIRLVPAAKGAAGRQALLDAAHAPWLAWTDAGLRWREDALLQLAEATLQAPPPRLVYADEDRLDAGGHRCEPRFKSDWAPELLLSHDGIGSPALWRSAPLRQALPGAAAADPGIEGAWCLDLALRGTEAAAPGSILHLPHVLCSRAQAPAEDAAASARAVQAHLDRSGQAAQAAAQSEAGIGGVHVRVRYTLPAPPPAVTIVIPTRNGLVLLRQCIDSILRRTAYPAYDILIVDNGSDDPACLRYLASVGTDARVRVLRDDRPFNYSALNNTAVAQARGEFVALLNDDTEVIDADWLGEMLSLAARPGIGAVGARLWFGDGCLQHAGVVVGLNGSAGHLDKGLSRAEALRSDRAQRLQAFSAVTAACLVVRRSTYLAHGGLDELRFGVALNDVDFCLRLREAGLRNLWTPHADLYHHESVSRGSDWRDPEKKRRSEAERAAFQARWAGWMAADPAYNLNLSLDDELGGLACPPRRGAGAMPPG